MITETLGLLALHHFKDSAIALAKDRFKSEVVEIWTKRQANAFLVALAEEVFKLDNGASIAPFETFLDKAVTNPLLSETLYDAYRQACLSASRLIGPRIIGILVGRIIHSGRMANAAENLVMNAAEQMTDKDMLDYVSFLDSRNRTNLSSIEFYGDHEDSNSPGNASIPMPRNLSENIGVWCQKLSNQGLLSQRIERSSLQTMPSGNSITNYSWFVILQPEALDLEDFIRKCQ